MNKIKSGYYWVYSSPCCQTPPSCSLPPDYIGLHGPPRWTIEYISSELGIRYETEWIPIDEFVGYIGSLIPEPDYNPSDIGWDTNWDIHGHYTMGKYDMPEIQKLR